MKKLKALTRVLVVAMLATSLIFATSCGKKSTSSNPAPAGETATLQTTLEAMNTLGELDGSYSGTNAAIGFPERTTRDGDGFETYPIGYGEGTTGGRGATSENIYECATGLEVLAALEQIRNKQASNADLKSIIKITAEITQANTTAKENPTDSELVYQIVVTSINNLSLIGANENAVFNGVGVNFKTCDNIIVQNLTIHHPSNVLKNEKDCLEFNTCNYVWVDHCEIFNDYPSNSSEKDYYDGLIDVKNYSSHVTVSYNYLHDGWKTSLVGSGPDDVVETRTITYHHNIFRDLSSRIPAIRGGYGHVYNNYYENIVGSCVNSRIEANVYVENNVFVNAKKPVCAEEETILGYYNISDGNIYENCKNWVRPQNTSTYTPSYRYTLDSAEGLKAYLDKTVGVNKVDVATACAVDESVVENYEVAENLLVDRAIDELPEITLSNDCLQRLLYLSTTVLDMNDETKAKLQNIDKLQTAVESYIDTFVKDLNQRIASINFSENFAENAISYLKALSDYQKAGDYIKNKITTKTTLDNLTAEYNSVFVTRFNAQVSALQNATSGDLENILNLLTLYGMQSDEVKSSLNYAGLSGAKTQSEGHVAAENFEGLCSSLPTFGAITHSDCQTILTAVKAYNALGETERSYVGAETLAKFNEIFNWLKTSTRKMDISGITEKKISTESAVAGDVNLSKNMEVLLSDVSANFDGTTYESAAYISGYGNKGTKSIWFSVYSDSDVEVVLSSIGGACKFIIADQNGNIVTTVTTSDENVTKLVISGLEIGEYRFYTAAADETYVATKAYVYDFRIVPKK